MSRRHILLALLVVSIWGFNFVIIKLSVEALPPLLAAGLRFFLAAFPAIIFVRPPKSKNGKTPWLIIAGFGLSFGFGLYVFLNLALAQGMPAGLASIVLQVQVFFTFLVAFIVLKERPQGIQIAGAMVAFGGIALIGFYRIEGASVIPFILTICAAFAWAIANVLARYAGRINPVALAVWGSLFAAVPLLVLSGAVEGPDALVGAFTNADLGTWGLLAFLAYPATLFGFSIWNKLLAIYPVSSVAPFTLLVPITGVFSSWAVLGESIAFFEVAGGLLVMAGLGITFLRTKSGSA